MELHTHQYPVDGVAHTFSGELPYGYLLPSFQYLVAIFPTPACPVVTMLARVYASSTGLEQVRDGKRER